MAETANGQSFTRTQSFSREQREGTIPRFFMECVQDPIASAQTGRECFKDEERVELLMPGNPFNRPIQRVTDEHREKWPREYDAFKKGIQLAVDGWPLEEWPRLRKAHVMELKAKGLQTVEQVAGMSDVTCQALGMAGMTLRNLAKAFLDDSYRNAEVERLTKEDEKNQIEISGLRNQLEGMRETLDRVQAQLMDKLNAPNALETMIPGVHDAVENAKQRRAPPQSSSSLDDLVSAAPRRRATSEISEQPSKPQMPSDVTQSTTVPARAKTKASKGRRSAA